MREVFGLKIKKIVFFIYLFINLTIMTSCKNGNDIFTRADKNCALRFQWALEHEEVQIENYERYDYEYCSYIRVGFYSINKKEHKNNIYVYTNQMFSTFFPLTNDFIEGEFKDYYNSYLNAKEYGTYTVYTGNTLEELFSYNWE